MARGSTGSTRDVDALRDWARHDDPASVTTCADMAAWERAEGWSSDAATEAIRRRDVERWIPGLPARRTYKVIGWAVVAMVVVDNALAWVPESDAIDTLDTSIRYGTAIIAVTTAAWSILSEVRGWDGSDAATWFLKARVKRYQKKLRSRRRVLGGTLIAIGAERIVVYRDDGGSLAHEAFAPDAILALSLDVGASHMVLHLTTPTGAYRFEWLPRDPAVEAAVRRLAGISRTREAVASTG